MSGKPGRSGPRPSGRADRVVPLFLQGMPAAEIARAIPLSISMVSHVLQAAGIERREQARAIRAARDADVRQLVEANVPGVEIAKRLGITFVQVQASVQRLRQVGVKLPARLSSCSDPMEKRVEELLKRKLPVAAVARRTGKSNCYVCSVRRRLGDAGTVAFRPIPRVNRRDQAVRLEAVRELWEENRGQPEIAEELGLTVPQVANCLKRLRHRGIKLRPAPNSKGYSRRGV
jgi:biotin operon repressor